MTLFELQFGGVFDGHDSFFVGDVTREDVQQRGLAGARSAGDDDVQSRLHRALDQIEHVRRERLIGQQIFIGQRDVAETANREMRTIDRQRRNDDVDARSVRQARVHHRRRFVHVPPNVGYDLVDDVHQVRVVLEPNVGFFQHSRAFDVHLLVAVHQNVVDGGILQQRFQRAQSENLIQNFQGKALALAAAHRGLQIRDQVLNHGQGLGPGAFVAHRGHPFQVHLVQQVAVHAGLQFLIDLEIQPGLSLFVTRWKRP